MARRQLAQKSSSPPTIYDVARACGVAPSTVSRALSRPGRVSAETAERVRQAAAGLGYRAQPLARARATTRTAIIALVVADITNPMHFDIIHGAESAAAQAGYMILLADTAESARREREAIERSISVVDGIVLGSTRLTDSAIRMVSKQRPLVVLNRQVVDVPSITVDNAHGMRLAVKHLATLGHESVTYLAGPDGSWTNGIRWRSLHESASELGMRVRRLGPYKPTIDGGTAATRDLCRQPTAAVIAYNDLIAIGLIRGLASAGVRVPEDVSVVGFDNISGSSFCTPTLTTVGGPLRPLGSAAIRQVLTQISGVALPTRTSVLPMGLVVRESTAERTVGVVRSQSDGRAPHFTSSVAPKMQRPRPVT